MASWAHRRQLGILFILLLFIAGIAVGLYSFIAPAPSCSDGTKNQDEINVDCGGVCERVCKEEAAPLVIIWSKVLKVNEGKYDAAAFVENPNTGFGIKKIQYSFKVYDSENILVAEKRAETFINPRERFVVFLPNIDTGKRIPTRAFVEFEEPFWQRLPVDDIASKVNIENKEFRAEVSPLLTADVVNVSPSGLSGVDVHAVISDAEGNALGVSRTWVGAIARGERKQIVFTWPVPFERPPVLTQLYLRVNQTRR